MALVQLAEREVEEAPLFARACAEERRLELLLLLPERAALAVHARHSGVDRGVGRIDFSNSGEEGLGVGRAFEVALRPADEVPAPRELARAAGVVVEPGGDRPDERFPGRQGLGERLEGDDRRLVVGLVDQGFGEGVERLRRVVELLAQDGSGPAEQLGALGVPGRDVEPLEVQLAQFPPVPCIAMERFDRIEDAPAQAAGRTGPRWARKCGARRRLEQTIDFSAGPNAVLRLPSRRGHEK